MAFSPENPLPAEPEIETAHPQEFVEQLRYVADSLPSRINVDAQSVEQGLAKLVLTLIEFIRRLLEKQAVRRMEGGSLTDAQVEEMGLALMKLEQKIAELAQHFGLRPEDLNLGIAVGDLGSAPPPEKTLPRK